MCKSIGFRTGSWRDGPASMASVPFAWLVNVVSFALCRLVFEARTNTLSLAVERILGGEL